MKVCNRRVMVLALGFAFTAIIGIVSGIQYQGDAEATAEPLPGSQCLAPAMVFVQNLGQWDGQVLYMARKQGMTAWLQKNGITFQFEKRSTGDQVQGSVVQMTFENASARASVNGQEKQSSKHNFFIGKEQTQWRSNVPSYAKVIYEDLYDGIDLCVREHQGWLEYDLLLSAGAHLHDVVICCDGLENMFVNEGGILVMKTAFGPVTQQPPTAWHELPDGERLPVTCHFRQIDDRRYGFRIDNDLGLALVIDPGLEWSTFLGGAFFERIFCLDIDGSGNYVVAGENRSGLFPTTAGAYDTTYNGGNSDIFVSCISPNGDSLIWSTYLGGSLREEAYDLSVDGQGRAIVVGITMSSDFPTTPGAYDTNLDGVIDAVMTCLSANGSTLAYSTYIGGNAEDWICAIELNSAGEAYIGGYTSSPDFPTTQGAYDTTHNMFRDAFIARVNSTGTGLLYSTFLGGSNHEGWAYDTTTFITREMAIALAPSGEIVIVGMTGSYDFPTTPDAFDTTMNGALDIFVTRLSASGSEIVYSTFFGGASYDYAYSNDLVLDPTGVVTFAGATMSSDLPTTIGAFDTTYNGYYDAFVARLNATGSFLLYSTFLGGGEEDAVGSMLVDNQGKIILTGVCAQGFPTTPGAYNTTLNGLEDVFVCRMSLNGMGAEDLVYSTFLGGPGYDWATSMAVIGDSTIVIAGQAGEDFPTTPGAYDTTFGYGGQDGFICCFSPYVGIEESSATQNAFLILSPVFPNPSHREFNYSINLEYDQKVEIRVYDVTGRLIAAVFDNQLPAGIHDLSWLPSPEVSSGTYFMQLRVGDRSETSKVLFVR